MVCKSLEVASQVMQRADMDSVSIEGEKVSKKGVFTGGYLDSSRFMPGTKRLQGCNNNCLTVMMARN